MAASVKTRTLRTAAAMLGGGRKLRSFLRVPAADVASWLAGTEEPPAPIFLWALEIILDDLDAKPAGFKSRGSA